MLNSGVGGGPKLVVALDFDNAAHCMQLVNQLSPEFCRVKIGKELFTACGPKVVENIQSKGFDVFLDLKFHDIPNTVAKAVKSAANLGVWMVNIHASGGPKMMDAAVDALSTYQEKPLLIAVTVLTSMDASQLNHIGVTATPAKQVAMLAQLARASGVDGVVSSAQEVESIKHSCGKNFMCVTPGIRPADAKADDQHRIMTPSQAIQANSDYLVVGRPITQAANPLFASQAIHAEIEAALKAQY